MKLKEYIKLILENVGPAKTVNFDIGIRLGIGKNKGKILFDPYSSSKVKFSIKTENK